MKAYRYTRNIETWHWSQNMTEQITFIPESGVAFYSGSGAGRNYKGITSDAKIIEEAIEYIHEVESGAIKKYLNDDHQEICENPVEGKSYPTDILMYKDVTYLKQIAEVKVNDNTTRWPMSLKNLEEIDIEITKEKINEILHEQYKFAATKSMFQIEQKRFEDIIDNVESLIKK